MKKMCATLLVATATLVSVFSNRSLTSYVFAAGMAVIVSFWLADSVGFFYQRKLRVDECRCRQVLGLQRRR